MCVAVIIPVFNGAATVGAAIRSALEQNFAGDYEVIVVDDGSTDTTAAILASFGARIRIVSQANRGLAAARNAGAAAASGSEYLAFLDADDLWTPDKLALTVAPLDRNRAAVLAYTDVVTVDDHGEVVAQSLIKPRQAHAPSMDELLHEWWPILPSTVAIRRDAFERCGRFCEEFRGAAGHEDVRLLAARAGVGRIHLRQSAAGALPRQSRRRADAEISEQLHAFRPARPESLRRARPAALARDAPGLRHRVRVSRSGRDA